jgi:hypothetical protein
MGLRVLRTVVAALLGLSGALMYAASWQRWADGCPWGVSEGGACDVVQDHLYDFLPPGHPWEPVGNAAQLAGWSLLVHALAFVLLPWALTARRPGIWSGAAVVAAALGLVSVGVATLRSGQAGSVVDPFARDVALLLWALVPPVLLVVWAVAARGWAATAAAVLLFLASPLVAAFSYAVGSYDSRPWWEAISGALTATAGLCLLVSAVIGDRSWRPGAAPVQEGADATAGGPTRR